MNPRQGPSFDCATASHAVEKAICSDEELARFDREIDAAYQAALGRLDKKKADALRRDQKGFLAERNRLFGRPEYQLKTEMERRLAQLRTTPALIVGLCNHICAAPIPAIHLGNNTLLAPTKAS